MVPVIARMLYLPALLLLAVPVLSSSGYFEDNDNYHEDVGDTCSGRRPTISSTTDKTHTTFFMNNDLVIEMEYGGDVTLYCTGRNSTLKIRSGDEYLRTEALLPTGIRYIIQKPNITINPSYTYEYRCVDNTTNCTSHYVSITVLPAMSVSASRVHQARDDDGEKIYFVPHGHPYQVFCSGQEATSLRIENISEVYVQVEVINQTTIKYDAQADCTHEITYWCHTNKGYISRRALQYVLNVIRVGYYPEAQNFQCTLYRDKNEFQCTWTALSVNNKFDLFYIDRSGNTKPFCVATPVRRVTSAMNEWNCFYLSYLKASLLLQSCNRIFCVNETFSEKQAVRIKYDPPPHFKLLNKNSRGATISWDLNGYCFSDWSQKCEYRLEYRLLGTDWRQVSAPPVRCINTVYDYKNNCEYEVHLKCPSKRYELRLYVRPTHQEPARAVWSEPTYLYLFTDPQDTDEEIDPECNVEYTDQAPPPSVDQVLHEVRLLENYGSKEQLVSRNKLSALKQKRAKIQALAQTLAAQK